MQKLAKINTLALTLMITGAIDSVRNLPATALFGSTLIFFFIFSAITFLIPTALISAELAANVNEGGIYQWCRLAFGERLGFLAVWLQWVNNIVWFPTILSFLAGTAAYLFNPALAQDKIYLISVILITLWTLTFINLKGIRLSAKFTSFCALVGLIIPMTVIIGLFMFWLVKGFPIQLHLTAANMLPNLHQSENWVSLTAIMLGFVGMELSTVHINDVKNPKKTFPSALAISTILILITMLLGSLAIAFVLPYDKINLVNGTIETFSYYLTAYHLQFLTPILTLMLVIGSLGGILSWVISPIRGISQAGEKGFLPPFLQYKNAHGSPQNLLIAQAILVSVVCLAFLLLPSINASYWLLSALTTELNMVMYLLMFLASMRLRSKLRITSNHFSIPGGKLGTWMVSLLGLIGCGITLLVGFIPPSNINIGSHGFYELIFSLGMFAFIAPILIFFWYQARRTKPETLKLIQDEESH